MRWYVVKHDFHPINTTILETSAEQDMHAANSALVFEMKRGFSASCDVIVLSSTASVP